jgi:hypothetical protein
MWFELKKAFEAYKLSSHQDICTAVQRDQAILDSDGFQTLFLRLVGSDGSRLSGNVPKDRSADDANVPASPSQSSARQILLKPVAYIKRLSSTRRSSLLPS